MTTKDKNDLSPLMQERLKKWRDKTLPVKSVVVLRGKSPGNYVARRRDHGDDMSEFDRNNKRDK